MSDNFIPMEPRESINLADLRLAVALPSYDGRRANSVSLMHLQRMVPHCAPIETQASLLAYGFNICLSKAWKLARDGHLTHFLMLHDDIVPIDPDWFRRLWTEYVWSNANMIAAVSPIKTEKGLTSTGVETDNKWKPRRLTIRECLSREPTFTEPGILLNTGMMLFDLREPWVKKCFFTIEDDMYTEDGMFDPRVAPEDWNFTRMARKNGAERIFATRAVKLHHIGPVRFDNYNVWGDETDGAAG